MAKWKVEFILEGDRDPVVVDEVDCFLGHNAPKVAWRNLDSEVSHEVGKHTVSVVVTKLSD